MLFHFTDLSRVGAFLGALFGTGGREFVTTELRLDVINNILWIAVTLLLCMPVKRLVSNFAKNLEVSSIGGARAAGIARIIYTMGILFVSTAFLVGNSLHAFLYFQF